MPSSLEFKTSLAFLSGALLALWLVSKIRKIGAREPFLPSGPPTTVILGNVHMFPTVWPWLKFTEWAKEHGDLYSLKIGPRTAIVITGVEAVKELMDKRNAATADRPKSWMAEAITGGLNMGTSRYTNHWRAMRKTANIILSPKAVESHLPIQEAEAMQLLHDFLGAPEGFFKHLRRYSLSVIMSMVFGKRCPRYESHDTQAFYEAFRIWNEAVDPGSHPPVDVLPVLNYIPERWAPWKQTAREVRRNQRSVYFTLLDECEKRVAKGEENGCYMEEILVRREEYQLDREMVGYLGGTILDGGSEATAIFLQSLLLFVTAFPAIQEKAQKEIDSVVGRDRLPSLDDIPSLPYIQALIKEVHRFRPAAPILLPHATLSTEEYRGYIIPKDTAIFVNMWGIFRNPEYFEDPDTFNPDRFLLNEFGTKPDVDVTSFRASLVFGCGRRICPGISLASNSIDLNTMNLLWAFNFKPLQDSEGKDIPIDLDDWEKGVIYIPRPFKCQITPRYEHVVEMVKREFDNATETFLKFERDLSPEDEKWLENTRG